jgi:ABC-type phosphate transport system substrate-binding protein
VLALAGLLLIAGTVWGQTAAPPYRVIVHPQNQAGAVTRRFLAEAFLKKTTRWADGEVIHPVDLGPDSPTRARFTEDVLSRSVGAVKSYWQQLIFAGRDLPPPEMESDAAIIRYVLHNQGAVGYISGDASNNLGGARVLTIK